MVALQYNNATTTLFQSIGIQKAGEPAQILPLEQQCIEIMTGAILFLKCRYYCTL
ncbi:MAG: hypothetical protein ACRC0A_07020 [Chitinophagaceae bacterium]